MAPIAACLPGLHGTERTATPKAADGHGDGVARRRIGAAAGNAAAEDLAAAEDAAAGAVDFLARCSLQLPPTGA
jgi:hypothetical protein